MHTHSVHSRVGIEEAAAEDRLRRRRCRPSTLTRSLARVSKTPAQSTHSFPFPPSSSFPLFILINMMAGGDGAQIPAGKRRESSACKHTHIHMHTHTDTQDAKGCGGALILEPRYAAGPSPSSSSSPPSSLLLLPPTRLYDGRLHGTHSQP